MRLPCWHNAAIACVILVLSGVTAHMPCQESPLPQAGVLVVMVQDENGKAIEGARIGIENQDREEVVAIAKSNGQIKGEVMVDLGPFILHVTAEHFLGHDVYGVVVAEAKTTEIKVILKKAMP
jgi:hypothetical protein